MGFFSGLLGGDSTKPTRDGFATLPPDIQNAFNKLGRTASGYIGAKGTQAFTPIDATADEQAAFGMIRNGFAPTQDSITADVGMQMNPYNSFVIDEINRQAGGDYSILKQNMNEAGQMGSNRGMLGANDIDLSRTNQIGGFLQDQYNTALNNAMTTLPQARAQDAAGLMGIGDFERNLDMQQSTAPITALQQIASAMGILPTSGGQGGGGTSESTQWGNLAGKAGMAMLGFSDVRLKEDIVPLGEENGHSVYEFSYKGDPRRFIGVMAHEVPEAAYIMPNGYLAVDYGQIGVEFREVTNGVS